MWFRHRAWIPVTWVLAVTNIAAVWFAAQPAEPWHATGHALLAVGLALGAKRLQERHRAAGPPEPWQQALDQAADSEEAVAGMQTRVEELEERLDFAERLLTKQREPAPVDSTPR